MMRPRFALLGTGCYLEKTCKKLPAAVLRTLVKSCSFFTGFSLFLKLWKLIKNHQKIKSSLTQNVQVKNWKKLHGSSSVELNIYIGKILFIYTFSYIVFSKNVYPIVGGESNHISFGKLLFLSPRAPQTTGLFLDISIARRKCLCVSWNILLWSVDT